MALVRCLRLGLLLPLLVGSLCVVACGGDDDDDDGERPESEGPAGCYIGPEMRCDCEIAETSYTEDGQTWVEEGCSSCAT